MIINISLYHFKKTNSLYHLSTLAKKLSHFSELAKNQSVLNESWVKNEFFKNGYGEEVRRGYRGW